jgi:hypothetical protein
MPSIARLGGGVNVRVNNKPKQIIKVRCSDKEFKFKKGREGRTRRCDSARRSVAVARNRHVAKRQRAPECLQPARAHRAGGAAAAKR